MAKLRKFKGSPYWYAEGRDSNNRRWSVSTKQTSKDAAARVGRRLEVERAVPGLRPLSLAQALAALIENKRRKKVSPSEIEIVQTKGARLLEHFTPTFNLQPPHLDRARINGYVDARRADGVSDSTIAKELGKLHEALRVVGKRWAGDFADIRTDVLTPAEPGDRWLDWEPYNELMKHVWHTRRDYLLVYCHVGVRYGELYRIEARHLDHEGMRVWVLGTKGKRQYRERWVPLSPDAYDVLAARAKLYPAGPLFPSRWLLPNMKTMLARAARRAGIEPVTANDLRRTFCSWHCRLGTSERECQKFMGHSPNSQLVRKVYAQLAPEAGREAAARFPRAPEGNGRTPAAKPQTAARGLSQQVSQTGPVCGGLSGVPRTMKQAISR